MAYLIVYIVILIHDVIHINRLFQASDIEDVGIGHEDSSVRVFADMLNIVCLVLMLPFAVYEGWALCVAGWIHRTEVCAIAMQVVISNCHVRGWGLDKEWFSFLIAFHCLILLTRLTMLVSSIFVFTGL